MYCLESKDLFLLMNSLYFINTVFLCQMTTSTLDLIKKRYQEHFTKLYRTYSRIWFGIDDKLSFSPPKMYPRLEEEQESEDSRWHQSYFSTAFSVFFLRKQRLKPWETDGENIFPEFLRLNHCDLIYFRQS